MAQMILSGNQAAALAVKLSRVQVISAYPITPQTSLIETVAGFWARGDLEGEFVVVESEYSAMSYLIGAAYAGARTFTASASHGLAYMHELLHWAAGARLPVVLVNVNRAMGAPWCLEPDQVDSLSQRDTGWMQLYCAGVQEILDTVILAFRLAEETSIPCMIIYDGFALSHTYEAVEVPEQEQVDAFLPPPPKRPALSPENPVNIQPMVDSRKMSELIRDRHLTMKKVPRLMGEMSVEFAKIFGRKCPVLEAEGLEGAQRVIIAAGSVSQTVKSLLPSLNGGEIKTGLLRLKLFRPFPGEELIKAFRSSKAKEVMVIDRNISPGAGGIFTQEVRSVLQGANFQGRVYQLNLAGGMDLTPELLQKALDRAAKIPEEDKEKIIWGVEL